MEGLLMGFFPSSAQEPLTSKWSCFFSCHSLFQSCRVRRPFCLAECLFNYRYPFRRWLYSTFTRARLGGVRSDMADFKEEFPLQKSTMSGQRNVSQAVVPFVGMRLLKVLTCESFTSLIFIQMFTVSHII